MGTVFGLLLEKMNMLGLQTESIRHAMMLETVLIIILFHTVIQNFMQLVQVVEVVIKSNILLMVKIGQLLLRVI